MVSASNHRGILVFAAAVRNDVSRSQRVGLRLRAESVRQLSGHGRTRLKEENQGETSKRTRLYVRDLPASGTLALSCLIVNAS